MNSIFCSTWNKHENEIVDGERDEEAEEGVPEKTKMWDHTR